MYNDLMGKYYWSTIVIDTCVSYVKVVTVSELVVSCGSGGELRRR